MGNQGGAWVPTMADRSAAAAYDLKQCRRRIVAVWDRMSRIIDSIEAARGSRMEAALRELLAVNQRAIADQVEVERRLVREVEAGLLQLAEAEKQRLAEKERIARECGELGCSRADEGWGYCGQCDPFAYEEEAVAA